VYGCVRLQFLDNCLRFWMDAPDHALEFLRRLLAVYSKNGERNISLDALRERLSLIGDGKFVGKVIESRAEIVQAVSGNEGKFRRHGFKGFDYKQLVDALNVHMVDQAVRLAFEPDSGFTFKALQVVERPI
jgi:hypothetical protein